MKRQLIHNKDQEKEAKFFCFFSFGFLLNKYECGSVSCARAVLNGQWLVDDVAHVLVLNHSQDQCACMCEVLMKYESAHTSQVMTRALPLREHSRGFKLLAQDS